MRAIAHLILPELQQASFCTLSDWPKVVLVEGTVVPSGSRMKSLLPGHDRPLLFAVKGHITVQKQVCSIRGL